MNKKILCEEYIEVMLDLRDKEEDLGNALSAINKDNYFIGILPEDVLELINNMFSSIVGEEVYEWVTWWLYEADQKSSRIWIDDVEIEIESFDDLWEAVLKDE